MKKLILFSFLAISMLMASAQQKPPYPRTATNQVLSDYGTWSRYFMGIPKGATPSFPSWVPDSIKCGAPFYNTTDGKLYYYDCTSSTWKVTVGMAMGNALGTNYAAFINSSGQFVKIPGITTDSASNVIFHLLPYFNEGAVFGQPVDFNYPMLYTPGLGHPSYYTDGSGNTVFGKDTVTYARKKYVDSLNSINAHSSTSGFGLIPTAIKTANYTAAAGEIVLVNAIGYFAITMPATPPDGTLVGVHLVQQTAPYYISVGSGGSNGFNNYEGAQVIKLLDEVQIYQYQASTALWLSVSSSLTATSLDANYIPVSGGNYINMALSSLGGESTLQIGTSSSSYVSMYDNAIQFTHGGHSNNLSCSNGYLNVGGPLGLKSYTVSGLSATPSGGQTGAIVFVTDALSPVIGSAVVGGGSASAMVWFNGSSWTVIGI
ncbi:hypothetical protein [Mucilaginibacter sp.]